MRVLYTGKHPVQVETPSREGAIHFLPGHGTDLIEGEAEHIQTTCPEVWTALHQVERPAVAPRYGAANVVTSSPVKGKSVKG